MIRTRQTLILGLGPAGRKTLEHLKSRLQTFGELPAFKLLALDVSQPSGVVMGGSAASTEQTTLSPTEFLDLPLEDVLTDPNRIKQRYPWFPERVLNSGPEWYQTRAASRLAFQINMLDVFNFLEYHFHQLGTMDARDAMAEKGFDITTDQNEAALIVTGSLGDPVGSGMLIDATYLIHYLVSRRRGMELLSTALLFMPSMAPSSPTAEACAYAAMKELNSFWENRQYRLDNSGLRAEFNIPPFNRGCYLIDTINEKSLTLKNQEEAHILGAEWLFRTLLTPLGSRIGGWVSEQAPDMRVQGQYAYYSSLGLAAYVLPTEELIDWSANRLGAELVMESLLKPELYQRVNTRVNDFLTNNRLRIDNLIANELRSSKDNKPLSDSHERINFLQTVPIEQVVPRIRQTMASLKEEILPGIKRQAEENARRVLIDIGTTLREEVRNVLKDSPEGGLSLIRQFMQRLQQEALRSTEAGRRREEAARGAVQQTVNELNRLGPELQNAVAGIPSITILAVAAVAGIIAPLLLTSLMVLQGFRLMNSGVGIALAVILLILALAGVFYAVSDAVDDVNHIRSQYVTRLNNYYAAEQRLALAQTAASLYPDIKTLADGQKQRLDGLGASLQALLRVFRSRLNTDSMCGQIGFALQNSVLTLDLINTLYLDELGENGVSGRVMPLMESAGSLDQWVEQEPEDLEEKILDYSCTVFSGMKNLRAVDLLNKQIVSMPTTQRQRFASDLINKAAPLWSYDAFRMGQNPVLVDQAFAGTPIVETRNEIRNQLVALRQDIYFDDLEDTRAVIVTALRRGMPLFGLRRLDSFRGHYLEAVKEEGKAFHVEDELAIRPDLMPQDANATRMDAATIFSVGRAVGLIQPREDGVYCFNDAQAVQDVALSVHKTDSVILLGAEPAWMNILL